MQNEKQAPDSIGWSLRRRIWCGSLDTFDRNIQDVRRALMLAAQTLSDDEPEGGAVNLAEDRLATVQEEMAELREEIARHAGDAETALQPAPQKIHYEPAAFRGALARYRSAAALRERLRHSYGTEEADAAIDHECSRYREAMLTEAVTVAGVLAKLELFEDFRCDDGGSMDRAIEAEILAALSDVRNLLAAQSPEASPAFSARVQAWRVLRDQYNACDETADAIIDPLHDAKQEAYDALLAEPVQTFGDVLAMARTIKEEDGHGTAAACHYDVAFDALLGAVESLAGGASR